MMSDAGRNNSSTPRRPATGRLRAGLHLFLALALTSCGSGPVNPDDGNLGTDGPNGPPLQPIDSVPPVPPPIDTTLPPPPPDTVPPPDTLTPPPPGTPVPPTFEGLAFGFAQTPVASFGEYSATVINANDTTKLRSDLESARRTNTRLFISFTGNEENLRSGTGFDIGKWKARTDRFRGVDLTPYIAEGTIMGNYVMDEPEDKANWNDTRVPPAVVEEIAAYSKGIWPTMPTMVRAPAGYLAGQQYSALDATRVQYLDRFGAIDSFIPANIKGAEQLGLALIGGLNVLNGGTGESGIPGRKEGKWAMGPEEIRRFGKLFLAEPYICAFLIFEYDSTYLARPGIRDALAELAGIARARPKKECR